MAQDEGVAASLLDRYGVRADAATCAYVADRWAAGEAAVPVLAGCARTGRPMAVDVVPEPAEAQ